MFLKALKFIQSHPHFYHLLMLFIFILIAQYKLYHFIECDENIPDCEDCGVVAEQVQCRRCSEGHFAASQGLSCEGM